MNAQKEFDEMAERDLCSWNTMISSYTKVGEVGEAWKLFDEMPERDHFSWTVMISGYVHHERPEEALELFRMMQRMTIQNPTSSRCLAFCCFSSHSEFENGEGDSWLYNASIKMLAILF